MPEKTLREFVDLLGFKLAPWQESIIEKIEQNPEMSVVIHRGRNLGRRAAGLRAEIFDFVQNGLVTINAAHSLMSTGEAEMIIGSGAAMQLKQKPKLYFECLSLSFDESDGCRVRLKVVDPAKYAVSIDPRGAVPMPMLVVDELDVKSFVAEEYVKLQNLVTPKELDTARDLNHALRLFDDEIEKAKNRRDGTVKAARKAKQNFIQKNLSK